MTTRNSSDGLFCRIAYSTEFMRKFLDCAHPLIPGNGGVDFYNSANLELMIEHTVRSIELARDPKNRYFLRKRLEVYESWLRAVKYIETEMGALSGFND